MISVVGVEKNNTAALLPFTCLCLHHDPPALRRLRRRKLSRVRPHRLGLDGEIETQRCRDTANGRRDPIKVSPVFCSQSAGC